ncbi:hypothetical protein MYX84_12330 [Acidobacteria bacterium AH-259-O06]|nr:hypothetical protein [Acidobacteria bacterium AH-259-O06]
MDLIEFKDLPDEARVWIHGFEDNLSEHQQEIIRRGLKEFLPRWVSHSAPVRAAFKVLFDRFVVTAAHSKQGISGCSMDSLVRNFKTFRTVHGLDGLRGGRLYFRNKEGNIQAVDQQKFQDLIESGAISSDTPVFQTLISTLGQLRSSEFETPFENSWLARTFPLPLHR